MKFIFDDFFFIIQLQELKFKSVEITEAENQEDKDFEFNITNISKQRDTEKCLKIKDAVNMSDNAYDKFCSYLDLNNILPSIHEIKKLRIIKNNRYELIKHNRGNFLDIQKKLQAMQIKKDLLTNNKLILKFSADLVEKIIFFEKVINTPIYYILSI